MSSASLEGPLYQRRILDHADQAEKNLLSDELPEDAHGLQVDILAYSRASARIWLGALGDQQSLREAERLLRGLLDSEPLAGMAHKQLVHLLVDQEQFDAAAELADVALQRWPDDPYYLSDRLWVEIAGANHAAAAITAAALADQASEDMELMFHAALGQILTDTGDRNLLARNFLETEHDYTSYIAAFLYAFEEGEFREDARRRLERRWAEVDRSTWNARLEQGDPAVWRDMLIGYYLERVTRQELFGPLTDEATFKESLFRNLPLAREGMLCEANFYDALLARAHGDRERWREALQAAIETQYRPYLEYDIAKFLLARDKHTPG